jgi:hypothetical protein
MMSASNRLKPVFLALIAAVLDVLETALFLLPAVSEYAARRLRAMISSAFFERDFREFVRSERTGDDI